MYLCICILETNSISYFANMYFSYSIDCYQYSDVPMYIHIYVSNLPLTIIRGAEQSKKLIRHADYLHKGIKRYGWKGRRSYRGGLLAARDNKLQDAFVFGAAWQPVLIKCRMANPRALKCTFLVNTRPKTRKINKN